MDPTIYEQSNISANDMSEMIKMAKAQQAEKTKKTIEEKQKRTVQAVNEAETKQLTNLSDIENVEHGSYVMTSDGTGGIVIDHELEAQKIRDNDETRKKLTALLDNSSIISDVNAYTPDYGEDAPEGYDPGVEYIKNNPYDPKVKQMMDLKEGFSQLTFGLPGHGLVDVDSEEGKRVSEALEKLRTGEVVLPTPEEYEAQKKAALKRRKKRLEEKSNQNIETNNEQNPNAETESVDINDELSMGEMPENAVMMKGVDDLLNNINQTETRVGEETPKIEPTETATITSVPPVKEGEPTDVKSPIAPQPINLAGIEEELDAEAHEPQKPTAPAEPEIKPEEIVEINVKEGEADKVIENLPIETYDKIIKSKVIKVNEVELKDVPTKTTRITDIARYRMLSKRRPNTNTAEVTERVLINSGFVVTLKAATSLEMATIFSSPASDEVDWEKEYVFCYEHTVGTSLGKLSYNEFVTRVDPSDIETILFGIYEISETDKRKFSIICGTNDGGCGSSYEYDTEINKLPDYDALSEESKERVRKIIAAKNSPDETRRIVNDSPTSIVKYVQCGEDRVITLRTTTGNMMIERNDRINDIITNHGPVIALLVLFVENIKITIKEREDVEPTTFLLDTTELLCEELLKLTDEELNFIKDIITDELVEYPTIKFTIKGPCRCPHCGNVKDTVPCSISELVFQRAQSVLG